MLMIWIFYRQNEQEFCSSEL